MIHPKIFAKYVEFYAVKIVGSLVKDAILAILVFTELIGVTNASLREEMESLVMSVSRSRNEDSKITKKIIEGYYN